METSPAPRSETLQGRLARWTTLVVLETWSERSKKTKQRSLAPGRRHQQHVGHSLNCIPRFLGQVCKILALVRPFHDDDEAAHEHVTEHMRDLGERLLHERDFSYEDITGHEEPPVDPTNTRRKHSDGTSRTRLRRTNGCGPRISETYARKTKLTSLEQPSVPPANASPDITQQEAEEDHDDKTRRIDEPESTVPTAAQDEVLTPCPVTFDSDTRNDEVAVDVPLPEETAEISGENSQGWITEEAFFTVSPGARQVRQRKEVKMNQLSTAERHEFQKSMEVEWQTLLKNQVANVLSLEGTAHAQARWPDPPWARTWKPDDSKPSRAKARLIIKGFTDPDVLDMESHSPTYPRGLYDSPAIHVQPWTQAAVWRCTVETRSSESNHSSSECRLMEFQESLVVFGCSCLKQLMDWPMVRENGGTVFLLLPEVWGSRPPSWNCVFWF